MPTTLALLVVACALAGCGRKAGLDLPPGAAQPTVQGQGQGQGQGTLSEPVAVQRDVFDPVTAVDKGPRAPRGEKKRIPLDAILD